jgi:NADH-quinone oxidoreductase subunit L
VVIVAFTGKPRSEGAEHAHEVPLVMLVPLVVLAFFSVLSAYGILAVPLQAMAPHGEHSGGAVVMACSLAVLIAGFLAASKLYGGKAKDPLNIPIFANKFYFDEFYARLVAVAQDGVAWIVTALERIFIGGLTLLLPAALSSRLGNWMRRLQSGSLQGYTFVLGLGIVVAVYLAVFLTAQH